MPRPLHITLLFGLLLPLLPGKIVVAQSQFDSAAEKQVLELINQDRHRHGLAPLSLDARLAQAAREHTALMVKHQSLSHQFDEEPPLQIRFANHDLLFDRVAENVGVAEDAVSVEQGFMGSPPHRANILEPQNNVAGVGVMQSRGHIYVTEDFAHRLVEYSAPQAEAMLLRAIDNYDAASGIIAPIPTSQPELRSIACNMAVNDAVDGHVAANLPGVRKVFVWTAADPGSLPQNVKDLLSGGIDYGYALGACFAPSVSHPGGAYWLVVIVY